MQGVSPIHIARSTSTSTSTQNTTPQLKLPAFPPSNKDFECNQVHTPDGIYRLSHEIYNQSILPVFHQGTHCVSIPHAKTAAETAAAATATPTTTATTTTTTTTTASLSATLASTKSSSAASSMSEQMLGMTPVQENTEIESSEEEGGGAIYFGQSAALPIPYSRPGNHHHSNGNAAPASSSASSDRTGSLLRNTPMSQHGFPTTNTQGSSTTAAGDVLTPILTVENTSTTPTYPADDNINQVNPSTSIGGSSSVGSLTSLFSRNSLRHHHHHHHHHHHPRKPKNSLQKTNSSFIAKMIVHEQIAKILFSRTLDDSYIFYNVGTNFIWADANQKVKDSLCKITFSRAFPTSHDVNITTSCSEFMDVMIGFNTGDCMWCDPISNKYTRLNKGGVMNGSSVTALKWVPGSEELFMAAFSDGVMLVLDKERDDQAFNPPPPASWAEHQFHATKPRKSAKYNPVSHWKVSDKGITDFEFSPDGSHVAVVSSDGTLRIIDYGNERLCDIFAGYFGRLNCIAWSPDGRYLLTGGQDDLVTIWSLVDQRIVARCQGHKSWVTSVAFDPWHCDGNVYRFGSVGEDCKLILWDFSFSALHRPKHKMRISYPPQSPKEAPRSPPVRPQRSETRKSRTLSRFRRRSSRSANVFGNVEEDDSDLYHPDDTSHSKLATVHPILNKDQVPYLQPIVVQTVHADPCSCISFRKDAIVTADRRGRVRTWGRP